MSKFSRQFTSSREAVGTSEVFPEQDEEAAQYVSSDNDSSEEDDEECVEQEADFSGREFSGREFSGIGADGRPISPVREANAIYPEEPTHSEEADFPAFLPCVDQTESTHRTDDTAD